MKINYFRLQLKNTFKIYPSIMIVTLATVLSIVIAGVALIANHSNNEQVNTIKIGMVGDTDEEYLKIGINALENMDSESYKVEIVEFKDEKTAVKKLKSNEIMGYLLVPDGFIDSIFSGENMKADYISLNTPENLGAVITNEVAGMISGVVTHSQNGMYSMQMMAEDFYIPYKWDKVELLMSKYIDVIIRRHNIQQPVILGVSDSVSFGGYYICGILLFFMLLWGISVNKIFSEKSNSLSKLLHSKGISIYIQAFYEFLSYLIITMITILILALLFGISVHFSDFGIYELKTANLFTCVLFIFKILPAVIMIALMQLAVYEVITNSIAAVMTQFIIAIGLGYVSGCFYPNYFFPSVIQEIAAVLPVGAAFSYLRETMSGTLKFATVLLNFAYVILFAFLFVIAKRRRIVGDAA